MKILLAEDDANIAVIAKLTLETMGGHTVTHVLDGAHALERALQEHYDLILLDEMMPKLSGHQVCSEYTKKSSAACPVIIMSANAQEPARLAQIGAKGSISKPFDPMTLNEQIKTILQSQRSKAG